MASFPLLLGLDRQVIHFNVPLAVSHRGLLQHAHHLIVLCSLHFHAEDE